MLSWWWEHSGYASTLLASTSTQLLSKEQLACGELCSVEATVYYTFRRYFLINICLSNQFILPFGKEVTVNACLSKT